MKRIHFDRKGTVKKHYFFWEPWGCAGCLLRALGFMVLLFILSYLLLQFCECRSNGTTAPLQPDSVEVVEVTVPENGVPPIDEDEVIDDDGRRIVSNRLNVLFSAEVGARGMADWTNRFDDLYPSDDYQVLFSDTITKLMALQVPPESRDSLKVQLPRQIPDIPFMVFEEEVMEGGADSARPFTDGRSTPWYFGPIGVQRAWQSTQGCQKVTVAVVDSYFDLDLPEFNGKKIVYPYNVATGGDDVSLPADYNPAQPDPVLCHGTMVAQLAGALPGGDTRAEGIAPGCALMPVSLGRRFGCLAMLQGLLYAINRGAQVVNISAGLSFSTDLSHMPPASQVAIARRELLGQEEVWKYVFDMADKFFVTVVWAAGNENVFTGLDASKRGQKTIKVSAVDRDMSKAMFSNWGNLAALNVFESTVSAPGVGIYCGIPGSDSGMEVDGTSFSAPIVTGTVALMKCLDSTLSTPQIAGILRSTGTPVLSDPTIGPVINIGKAIDSINATFAKFDALAACCSSDDAYPAAFEATILSEAPVPEGYDPSARRPLLTTEFIFTDKGTGTVKYTANIGPDSIMSAPFAASLGDGGSTLTIRQTAAAVCASDSTVRIDPVDFSVARGTDGSAEVQSSAPRFSSCEAFHVKKTGRI